MPASGALHEKGDVRAEPLLVECKATDLRVYELRLTTVEKISREAQAKDLTPALALRLEAIQPDCDRDWIMIPLRVLAALIKAHATDRQQHEPE